MKVSVVIPVYNAEDFLETAVESALSQPEVAEVLLVEDKSPDNSLTVCKRLTQKYPNVRLLQHLDGKNHGAAATRNLGIQSAGFEFIAFLDADDYYLPGRFESAKKILENDENIDGVFEAIGMHFYNDSAKQKWFSSGEKILTTITEKVPSNRFFELLISGSKGYLHLDGLVVRKTLFEKCDLFLDGLRLHQDTALFIQMSLTGQMVPGSLDIPVAMRGIHDDNRILAGYNRARTLFLLWSALFRWASEKGIRKDRLAQIFHNYIYYSILLSLKNKIYTADGFSLFKESLISSLKHPVLFKKAVIHHLGKKFLVN